jgi:hypothetical protein
LEEYLLRIKRILLIIRYLISYRHSLKSDKEKLDKLLKDTQIKQGFATRSVGGRNSSIGQTSRATWGVNTATDLPATDGADLALSGSCEIGGNVGELKSQ